MRHFGGGCTREKMHDNRLWELLRSGAVIPALRGSTVDDVATELVDRLVEAEAFPPSFRDAAIISLLKRESISTTGLGAGVALPHAKVSFVRDFVAALGVSPRGIDFRAADSEKVRVVFLLYSPAGDPYGHLWWLGTVAGLVRQPKFVDVLCRSTSRDHILERIAEAEARLHGD